MNFSKSSPSLNYSASKRRILSSRLIPYFEIKVLFTYSKVGFVPNKPSTYAAISVGSLVISVVFTSMSGRLYLEYVDPNTVKYYSMSPPSFIELGSGRFLCVYKVETG